MELHASYSTEKCYLLNVKELNSIIHTTDRPIVYIFVGDTIELRTRTLNSFQIRFDMG